MSSLDPKRRKAILWRSMQKLRATIVAVIALALAGLPVPAAAIHASMIAGLADGAVSEAAAAGDHCCPEAETCDKHTKKGCDRSDACAAKCAALSANLVAQMDLSPLPAPSLAVAALTETLHATKTHPPSPPPRL